jgi:hypothetical protein
MQITKEEIVKIIDQEISWCMCHNFDYYIDEEYKKGFINGMESVKKLFENLFDVLKDD